MQSNNDDVVGTNRAISVRFSESDRIRVAAAADKASLSVSEYIRRCVLKRKIPSEPDMAVLKELHRIAMSLKQLAMSATQDRVQLDGMLKALRDVFERLCK